MKEGFVLVRNPYNPMQVTRYSLSPDVVDLIAFCTKNPAPVGWRYAPIFIDDTYSVEHHLEAFEKMAAALSGYTKSCIISFIDIYKKVEHNFPKAKEVSKKDRSFLGKEMIRIAKQYGMVLKPCAEGDELAPYGADCSGCMTVSTFETALHANLDVPKRKSNQRNGQCACLLGVDIGA